MPTYTVTTANIALSPEQKARIASAITAAHGTHTGAPGYFAQVIFAAVAAGDHFIGGKLNKAPHVYILGIIRADRTDETKRALMEQILREARQIAGVGAEDIWAGHCGRADDRAWPLPATPRRGSRMAKGHHGAEARGIDARRCRGLTAQPALRLRT